MKLTCVIVGCLAVIGVLLWSILAVSLPATSPPWIHIRDVTAYAESQQSAEEILRHTEVMMQNYDRTGKFWMKVVDDEKADIRYRGYAAKVLGTMKYPPAIPLLIEHSHVMDGRVGYTDGDGGYSYYVIRNQLELYGNAAVPQIVNAYLDRTDRQSPSLLLDPIYFGKTSVVAKAYLLGLNALGDRRVTDHELDVFGKFK